MAHSKLSKVWDAPAITVSNGEHRPCQRMGSRRSATCREYNEAQEVHLEYKVRARELKGACVGGAMRKDLQGLLARAPPTSRSSRASILDMRRRLTRRNAPALERAFFAADPVTFRHLWQERRARFAGLCSRSGADGC
jgi:hypothetical protein